MIKTMPCVRIKLTDTKPTIFDSKIGGLGYIPQDKNFPCDSQGNQLRLLAQIDCSQVNLEDFPKSGLLQFWVLNDEKYGSDFENPIKQDKFKIIYYSEIDKTVTEQEVFSKFVKNKYDNANQNILLMEENHSMLFQSGVSIRVYFDEDEEFEDYEDKLKDEGYYHKIGGHLFSMPIDPKTRAENLEYDFLLFQIELELCLMPECCGRGYRYWNFNFFIKSENLKKIDFSDVWYNCEILVG